jgi:undecaprenyl-diphosphatase
MNPAIMLSHLGSRDRTLFLRWSLRDSSHRWRRFWTVLTHAGGATATILAAVVPLFLGGEMTKLGAEALFTLAASHIVVQLVKRTVGRPRPSLGLQSIAHVVEPDRFSFPSGHAAAAMAVAFIYATAFPLLAVPLIVLACSIGISRVMLGVHYPGDVLAGQLIAVLTGVIALRL